MDDEELPIPREAFERLPMDVQVQTLEKMRRNRAFLYGNIELRRKRAPRGAAMGAGLALILAPTVAFSFPFALLMAAGGAVLGFVFVVRQVNHILGIVLFGGWGIGGSIFAYTMNWLNTNQTTFMFFGWIFYCCAGGLLAWWACGEPPGAKDSRLKEEQELERKMK